jgi:hypothetical protein
LRPYFDQLADVVAALLLAARALDAQHVELVLKITQYETGRAKVVV